MPALTPPFVAVQWAIVQPCDAFDTLHRNVRRMDLVWMPVDIIEMYRKSHALLLALEACGVKKHACYTEALKVIRVTASSE